MIFSRKRGSAGRRSEGAGRGGRHGHTQDVAAETFEEFGDPPAVDDVTGWPEYGPYDVSAEPTDEVTRLDLGALRIPTVEGVDIQLEAAPNGEIQRVQLAHGGSRLQLGAFAAPRSEGIWDEVRAELRTALTGSGAKLAEVEGEYGTELQARLSGGQGVVEVRHVGIDGPRWFVHGVYIGAAAVDPDQSAPLREALRGLVVDRGNDARPVKEPLPLRLPAEAAAQLAEIVASGQGATDPAGPDLGGTASTESTTGAATRPSAQPATPGTEPATPPSFEPATPPSAEPATPGSDTGAPSSEPGKPSRGTATPRSRTGKRARGGTAAARRGSRGGRSPRTANEEP